MVHTYSTYSYTDGRSVRMCLPITTFFWGGGRRGG